ncbi:MAG TPA: T9SS type A sorting domain-containing protein, partial [Niastella sp.]
ININLGANTNNIRNIHIIDFSGRLVMESRVGRLSNISIVRKNWHPGTYLVRMQGDKIIHQKIVVQ